ncbi:MAG: DsrE family protein [Proteobacteria bacterium]|nr:DsrE family protein [Pseudomonadota bacterium]
MEQKVLTISLMDAPYESENSTTAFRIIDAALRKGHSVNVFAYEGAVMLAKESQKPHPNWVRGTSVADEDHVLTKDWVSELLRVASQSGSSLNWINCGLCEDERGTDESVQGVKRGGPADFVVQINQSDTTLIIPTKRNC